ncbi:MAG: glutaredoxin family protein [Burkholderiales bacterium]|nr:glutaredoxin family protein [Burkholderiales bacterium]
MHDVAVLTLLSRSYCHLCDEMREALQPIVQQHGIPLIEVDVDAHPGLDGAWGDKVPVLMLGAPADGVEICCYRLDRGALEKVLRDAGP